MNCASSTLKAPNLSHLFLHSSRYPPPTWGTGSRFNWRPGRCIHTPKILRLSEDLSIVVEIVDEVQKIKTFLPTLNQAFDEANCGGLVTV